MTLSVQLLLTTTRCCQSLWFELDGSNMCSGVTEATQQLLLTVYSESHHGGSEGGEGGGEAGGSAPHGDPSVSQALMSPEQP